MTNSTDSGFIKLQRKILDWEWYNDIPTKTLFIHLLLKVNFKDKKWKGYDIKRGQVLTGRKILSDETGLSEQQTKTALKKLQATNEITIQATNRFSIITLVNYSLYQDKKTDSNQLNNQPEEQQATSNQPANDPTSNQQATTTKNDKKEKELKNDKKENKYLDICDGFIEIMKEKQNKTFTNSNLKGWRREIRLLIDNDLINRENPLQDVVSVIQAISDNYGKDYFPIIQSGKSLRRKFTNIENYIKRNNKNNYSLDFGDFSNFGAAETLEIEEKKEEVQELPDPDCPF
jgi:hypothetical protein